MKITKKYLIKSLEYCEKEYKKCWEILCTLKTYDSKKNNVENIIFFQEYLAIPIFELSKLHYELVSYKKSLISRKINFNQEWFKNRLKLIYYFEEIIKEFIKIGKSIGDAFVWAFFEDDRTKLENLSKENDNFYMPSRIGGLGELEFIKNTKHINKMLVLYNGITNILTLGDFTLVNLKNNKFAGIGEIKSHKPNENTLTLTISLVGDKSISELKLPVKKSNRNIPNHQLPKWIEDKLERQTKKMSKFFAQKEKSVKSSIRIGLKSIEAEIKTGFESVNYGSFYSKIISSNRLLIIYKGRAKPLYKRLEPTKITHSINKKLDKQITKGRMLLIEESKYNSILVGSLNPANIMIGTRPIFWHSLSCDILEKIYFHKISALFVYNLASLFRKIEESGFSINYGDNIDKLKISYKKSGKIFEIHKLQYFVELIINHLTSEDEILEMLTKLKDNVFSQKVNRSAKINLRMVHKL